MGSRGVRSAAAVALAGVVVAVVVLAFALVGGSTPPAPIHPRLIVPAAATGDEAPVGSVPTTTAPPPDTTSTTSTVPPAIGAPAHGTCPTGICYGP